MLRIIAIIFSCMATCLVCNAQARSSDYLLIARIVSTDSIGEAVRNCHIINKTKRTGTVSNQYGDFRMTADINDSISFSAIGYEKIVIALSDSVFNSHIIKLRPVAYDLEEVTVKPVELHLPPISKFEVYTAPLPNQGGINIPTGISPVSFFYNRFSKEAKQKKRYKSIVEGTANYMILGEKFNGELVARLTGLKDDELIAFISWCNFSSEFLKTMSPATIKREILKKYKKYTEMKNGT